MSRGRHRRVSTRAGCGFAAAGMAGLVFGSGGAMVHGAHVDSELAARFVRGAGFAYGQAAGVTAGAFRFVTESRPCVSPAALPDGGWSAFRTGGSMRSGSVRVLAATGDRWACVNGTVTVY